MIGVSFAWLFTVGVLRVPFVFSVKLLLFFFLEKRLPNFQVFEMVGKLL